ncbi:hypothetical protein EhVM1_000120 [Emiliania huxleyi virus M1]|nr:hypothetical protein EhVM1_000120 [Emiliania huxleyi virus M1]|mmetsp:Transcript_22805/g.65037  ORF Transcript_22805/g.65037 Transcript_22805/m.65037 type:complete len:186 (-) Transcript_22805:412-969(-)
MENGSVIDAFSMWLFHTRPLYVLQTVSCLNREWNAVANTIDTSDICNNMNKICNKWFENIKEIYDESDNTVHYNIRRSVKNEVIRMSGVNHYTILKLKQSGLSRDHACHIVRSLQILYRQPWAIRKLHRDGVPVITPHFLKTLNSNLCAVHGTKCNRTRRKICITHDYKFELSCRCRTSITRLGR